jgi:hypothetical protein
MREGLRDLHDTYPVLPDQLKRSFSGKLVETMLLSGLTPLPYATAIGEDSTSKAVALVRFAALMEEWEQMGKFAARFEPDLTDTVWHAWARGLAVAKGMARKSKVEGVEGMEAFESAMASERSRGAVRPAQEFAYATAGCALARATGQGKAARKYHDEAQQRLDNLDAAVSPQMLAQAQHWANALAIYPAGSKAREAEASRAMAQGFFREFFEKGYGSYARFL